MKKFFILSVLGSSLFAADFTVSTAVTAEQVLPDSNDVGTITSTGSITITGADNGVTMNSNSGTVTGQRVINNGIISVDNGVGINNNAGGNSATIINNNQIIADVANGDAIQNAGSSCTITNNGTLTVSGSSGNGIVNTSTGTSCTLINAGIIDISGTLGSGMLNQADSCTLINSGRITLSNTSESGLVCNAANLCTLINSGTIITTSQTCNALVIGVGSGCTLINSGTIITSGDEANGMELIGNSSGTVINSGSITASGDTAHGIRFTASTTTSIANSGSILASGPTSDGINLQLSSTNVTINNSGLIQASGTSGDGLNSSSANTTLINSGTIKSVSANAINFTGANPTLSLKRGSNLQGTVNSDNALNLIVERGLNLRLTIEELNGFGTITTSMPYVTVGNTETISTVDQSSFAMQSDIIEDLSDSILDAIYRNQDYYMNCCFPDSGAWVAGIGSSRIRTEYIEVKNWQGGFLVGYDKNLSGQNALGLFVGGSSGTGRVENNTASAETQSYFGGATYEQLWGDTFFGAAMAGGYYSSKNRRQVMYNLAPGGEETARSNDYGGMFTTEIYAARWFLKPGMSRPLLTAALRYAGLYLGSYSEKDSSANLSVQSRNISLIKPKLLLNFVRPGKFWKLDYTAQPYIGVAGRFQVSGDQVNGELLNQSISFDSTAPKNAAELLYGLYGSAWSESRCSLFYHFQGLRDSASSSRFLGEGGINYQF